MLIKIVRGAEEVVPVNIGQDVSITCDSDDQVKWRMATWDEDGGFHAGYLEGDVEKCRRTFQFC